MKKSKFQRDCERVSEQTDIEMTFFPLEQGKSNPHEDDGNLHITKRGQRACFDVGRGQCLDGKEQNQRTRLVMAELGIEVEPACLVDETEEEEVCECCGQPI